MFNFEGLDLEVYDIPGLHDAERSLSEWHDLLRKGVKGA